VRLGAEPRGFAAGRARQEAWVMAHRIYLFLGIAVLAVGGLIELLTSLP
jgi:hypothetical protein